MFEHGVDCQIAPGGVFLQCHHGIAVGDEDYLVRFAAIAVLAVAAQSGNFKLDALTDNDDDPELSPHREDGVISKNREYLLRRSVGGDVVVLGRQAQETISHTTPDEEGDEAGSLQLRGQGNSNFSGQSLICVCRHRYLLFRLWRFFLCFAKWSDAHTAGGRGRLLAGSATGFSCVVCAARLLLLLFRRARPARRRAGARTPGSPGSRGPGHHRQSCRRSPHARP